MKEKLKNIISSVFNYDRLDAEQIDDVVNEIMTEFNNQKDKEVQKRRRLAGKYIVLERELKTKLQNVRKETANEILDIVEKQGVEICQGELSYSIYGLLIDFKKIKKQIKKEL